MNHTCGLEPLIFVVVPIVSTVDLSSQSISTNTLKILSHLPAWKILMWAWPYGGQYQVQRRWQDTPFRFYALSLACWDPCLFDNNLPWYISCCSYCESTIGNPMSSSYGCNQADHSISSWYAYVASLARSNLHHITYYDSNWAVCLGTHLSTTWWSMYLGCIDLIEYWVMSSGIFDFHWLRGLLLRFGFAQEQAASLHAETTNAIWIAAILVLMSAPITLRLTVISFMKSLSMTLFLSHISSELQIFSIFTLAFSCSLGLSSLHTTCCWLTPQHQFDGGIIVWCYRLPNGDKIRSV